MADHHSRMSILLFTLLAHALHTTASVVGLKSWTQVADIDFAGNKTRREQHAMASLSDGSVLMYGGTDVLAFTEVPYLTDAFVYSNDKRGTAGGTWTKVENGPGRRCLHAMASLSDDKVLMYGGKDGRSYVSFQDASIYEGGKWTPTRTLGKSVTDGPGRRNGHGMAQLSDGRVFMYGGQDDQYNFLNDAYIFTDVPATKTTYRGTWTRVADGPSRRRVDHGMAPLGGGRVLIYGGTSPSGGLFNDTWIYTSPSSSLTSSDGKGGGGTGSGSKGAGGGTWTQVADGPGYRDGHAMVAISDGRVLMYGGETHLVPVSKDTFIYTPPPSFTSSDGNGGSGSGSNGAEGGTWTRVEDGPTVRKLHAMASLSDGRVLMYGGEDDNLHVFNDTWVNEPPPAPKDVCCQTKSPDYKIKCATFVDATSCDDYSKGFGDFCIWKC